MRLYKVTIREDRVSQVMGLGISCLALALYCKVLWGNLSMFCKISISSWKCLPIPTAHLVRKGNTCILTLEEMEPSEKSHLFKSYPSEIKKKKNPGSFLLKVDGSATLSWVGFTVNLPWGYVLHQLISQNQGTAADVAVLLNYWSS